MSVWTEPIVDRTAIDIEQYEELRKQLYLNVIPWSDPSFQEAMRRSNWGADTGNRIEGNIQYVNDMMLDLGYMANVLDVYLSWDHASLDTQHFIEELERIRGNLVVLSEAYRAPPTPLPDDMEFSEGYYEKINALEKVTLEICSMMQAIIGSLRYSGALVAGDWS